MSNEYKCKNCGFIFRSDNTLALFCPKCHSNAVDLNGSITWQSQASLKSLRKEVNNE